MDYTHEQTAKIADGLGEASAGAILFNGIAYGRCPFHRDIMRPLERKGYFSRIEQKGFQTFWNLTPLGIAIKQHLEARNDEG